MKRSYFAIIPLMLLMFIGLNTVAKSKGTTIDIKTNAVCDECKERIEKAVHTVKGVKKADLNLDANVLTVTFDPNKTDAMAIKKAVLGIGYDADDMKADATVRGKLPSCCRVDKHK